jgi:predicted ester cyclase
MTPKGEYRGIAPTGKTITERQVYIYRIANGKVAEGRAVSEELKI